MANGKTISLDALTSIQSAAGRVAKGKDGLSVGELTLTTGAGPVLLSLAEFDNIYRGFVKCWPYIKPIKDQIIEASRSETKAAKDAERQAEKDKVAAERKAAKEAKDKARAEAKAAKDKAKAEAKAVKEKAAADALAAKKKADAAKLKAAANAKAKKDAAGK
jgi:hypothetical protein